MTPASFKLSWIYMIHAILTCTQNKPVFISTADLKWFRKQPYDHKDHILCGCESSSLKHMTSWVQRSSLIYWKMTKSCICFLLLFKLKSVSNEALAEFQLTIQKTDLWPTQAHQHVQKGSSGHHTAILSKRRGKKQNQKVSFSNFI